jgi:hypothetical protein
MPSYVLGYAVRVLKGILNLHHGFNILRSIPDYILGCAVRVLKEMLNLQASNEMNYWHT